MRCSALVLLLFLCQPAAPSESEDSLTFHIINSVLKDAARQFPSTCPSVLHPVRTETLSLLRNDTLYVPAALWGFNATNDYRLQFQAGLLLFHRLLSGNSADTTAEGFYRASVAASEHALGFIHSVEQDPVLDGLILNQFALAPYRETLPGIVIRRDYRKDSLRTFCMFKAILGHRCDSTLSSEWINGSGTADYGIVSCTQAPDGFRRFKIQLTVKNRGELATPLEIRLRFSSGDSLVRLPGFPGERTLSFDGPVSILSVELDPFHRLYTMDEEGHRFVSREYINKHRVRLMVIALIWDLTSLLIAFSLLLCTGIFIQPLTKAFYLRTRNWYAGLTLCACIIKLYLPASFFGFTMWGFVYDTTYLLVQLNDLVVVLSLAVASAVVYYAFEQDGVPMNKLASTGKFLLTVSVVEPLLLAIAIFMI